MLTYILQFLVFTGMLSIHNSCPFLCCFMNFLVQL
uniref:Uncharacterized protein n=1 Tax=Arundo donax TaxID=35708 RepID=A0A0A9ACW6_ARUDO